MTDEEKRSKRGRKIAVGAVAALAVAGGGGAVAATQLGSPSEESKKIVDDVAQDLGVTSSELTAALKKALKNRVDEALAAGRVTEDEAKALKARIDASDYPLIFGGPRFFGGHRHIGLFQLDAAASYLGLTEAELRTELGSGSTLAEVAKEKGKTVDGLVDALVAAAKKDLDAAVDAGRLTRAQADLFAEGLNERITALVNGERAERFRFGPGFGHRFQGGPPVFGEVPFGAIERPI